MMQETGMSRSPLDGYVEFRATGDTVKGEYHCSQCGYGVAIVRALPLCPMCGGSSWEQAAWSPFSRAASTLP
jgi:rubrerythrin